MTDRERFIILLNLFSFSSPALWRKFQLSNLTEQEVFDNFSCLSSSGFDRSAIEKMENIYSKGLCEAEFERALAFGATPLFISDESYPHCLLSLECPPPVLFIYGSIPESGGISIVGTRRCSSYGMNIAHSLGETLALSSIPVISGGASGIDGSAHSGAIDGGYPTWAVLGTGVDKIYPRAHDKLFRSIVEAGGGLVSQFSMGTEGIAYNFPRRNEIVAALSKATVVVESPEKGGSMITARLAASMGRDIWAVPGRIGEKICVGSNRLIFDGAQPLYDVNVFMDFVAGKGQLQLFNDSDEELDSESLSILSLLRERGTLTVDEISMRCNMSLSSVLESLLNLDILEKVYRSGPGRWSASL